MSEDFDKTRPPLRITIVPEMDATMPGRRVLEPIAEPADIDATMPGKRDRKDDGRFAVGDLIMNRYKVLSELGQGGMGVVYKCFDETAGVEVALKALPPELSHNTLEMEDIKENFQLVSQLVHQNIAVYKNLERDLANGNYYLIMECCEGEDLRRWIKRKRKEGTLTLEAVLPIIQQVAAALDYAHSEKIIHRDIKPGNIMIDQSGKIKVLDFGLAAQIHTSMTRVSMAYHGTSGTGPYMAPEQWRGRQQDAHADQYALAVMTYEMLAGHLPFESTDAAVLREAVLNEIPESVGNIPAYAEAAILRALSKNPAERFATCSKFVAALSTPVVNTVAVPLASNCLSTGITQMQNVYAVAVPPAPPIESWHGKLQQKKNSKLKWLGGIVMLMLVGGFGVYYSFFNPKKSSQESGGNTVQGDIVVDPKKDDSDTTKKTVDEKAENMLKVKNPIKSFTLPNGVKLEMVKIKADSFTMGCPTSELGCWDDEGEVSVKLTKDYYIGKYEVTQAQWESIMKGKRSRRDDKDISNPSYFKSPDRPVERVTWDDARDFCAKLNSLNYKKLVINGVRYKFDLPTEAQWEYACRAGTTTSLNSGENMQICATNDSPNLDEVGWYAGNCGQDFELSNGYDISSWKDKQYSDTKGGTHPVGKKQPNKWGLYDMHGNVAEWCLDDYRGLRSSSMAEFSRLNPDNSGSRYCVWRGGGWSASARKCRSASRGGNHVGMGGTYGRYVRFIDLGFRVALVPAE